MKKEKVLFVDDDLTLLASFRLMLKGEFEMVARSSPGKALELLKELPHFSVILSELQMPEMDGIQFLKKCREISPNSVRITITAKAGLKEAVQALNEGNIFKFLLKPCDYGSLLASLRLGSEQYRRNIAEKELLEKTLKGIVKVLVDILSLAHPMAFRNTLAICHRLRRLAPHFPEISHSQIELAGLLSQIGTIGIPPEILVKREDNQTLSEKEDHVWRTHPFVGRKLLSHIPRLEQIADGIAYQFQAYDGKDLPYDGLVGKKIPIIGRLLKVTVDFENFLKFGSSEDEALKKMNDNRQWYDPQILKIFSAEITGKFSRQPSILPIALSALTPGMILMEPIVNHRGIVLLSSGIELTEPILIRVKNSLTLFGLSLDTKFSVFCVPELRELKENIGPDDNEL